MNYSEAVSYIHGLDKFGSVLGLENIKALLQKMGNPQDNLKIIHISGTNGKGSTSAYIHNILKDAGFKTGLYISPFVYEFTERIQINNTNIDTCKLGKITEFVKCCAEELVNEGKQHPTQFEVLTAIAFKYFSDEECDFVVLEVGMGGRLDATNVVKSPLVSVITLIDYDHTQQLGTTLEEIAYEKCGIIKENSCVVTYASQKPEVLRVIKQVCSEKNSRLFIPDYNEISVIKTSFNGTECIYKNREINIPLGGIFQIKNALTAIYTTEVLQEIYTVPVTEDNIYFGILNTKFPGRMEVLSKKPFVIIDGAHNISGVTALKESLDEYFKEKKITVIMGMLKDKEYEASVNIISENVYKFIATSPDNPRALSASELAKLPKCNNIYSFEYPFDAINYAVETACDDEVVCVCGSLYMLGDIKKYFE